MVAYHCGAKEIDIKTERLRLISNGKIRMCTVNLVFFSKENDLFLFQVNIQRVQRQIWHLLYKVKWILKWQNTLKGRFWYVDVGDKLIEVVGVQSAIHAGSIYAGVRSSAKRLGQCSSVVIRWERFFFFCFLN